METLTSRKNPFIARLRELASGDADELVLDGEKLLREAVASGAEITGVLWSGEPRDCPCAVQYLAPAELAQYASPLKNGAGPVFSARLPRIPAPGSPRSALVLESVQDPGNVGTIIRGAAALGTDVVILTGDCAKERSSRCARATMGAVFRQCVLRMTPRELREWLTTLRLPLYGAALTPGARDISRFDLSRAAVAIGNEGHGLSDELLSCCDGELLIPMEPGSESLNAAMAATITMWEQRRARGGRECPT